MYNLLGILFLLLIGLWVFKMYQSKKQKENTTWLPLPKKPQPTVALKKDEKPFQQKPIPQTEPEAETLLLPQYAYYHYRTPYFVNKQVPCVVWDWEIAEDGDGAIVYYGKSMLDGGDLVDLASCFDLLGIEAPEVFIHY